MATILDKQLKRQIDVDGAAYTIVLDRQGMRLVRKGKRRPDVDLRWSAERRSRTSSCVERIAVDEAKYSRRVGCTQGR